MFICLECSRKFRTVKAAEKAANDGCPGCGGVDIDIDTGESSRKPEPTALARYNGPSWGFASDR